MQSWEAKIYGLLEKYEDTTSILQAALVICYRYIPDKPLI